MTRYALIDNYTGYIWGVVDAASPLAACRTLDAELRQPDRHYFEQYDPDFSNESGYHVYPVPASWDCTDGEDETAIAYVTDRPRAAYFSTEDMHQQNALDNAALDILLNAPPPATDDPPFDWSEIAQKIADRFKHI
jgi:hypothetical protein